MTNTSTDRDRQRIVSLMEAVECRLDEARVQTLMTSAGPGPTVRALFTGWRLAYAHEPAQPGVRLIRTVQRPPEALHCYVFVTSGPLGSAAAAVSLNPWTRIMLRDGNQAWRAWEDSHVGLRVGQVEQALRRRTIVRPDLVSLFEAVSQTVRDAATSDLRDRWLPHLPGLFQAAVEEMSPEQDEAYRTLAGLGAFPFSPSPAVPA